jgi:hypothetical protein
MDQYQELMARRELIAAKWMEYVERVKLAGGQAHEFYSAGVILRPSGELWMQGLNSLRTIQLELAIAPGETEVRVVHESPRFKVRLEK